MVSWPESLMGFCVGFFFLLTWSLPLPMSLMSASRCSVRLSGPLDAVIFPISDGYVWVALRWLWSLTFCNVFFEALQSAAKSYLKDLPFYLPPTFIFKDLPRVYLPVIQVSSFCSLSEIYTGCKYNDVKSEKNPSLSDLQKKLWCAYIPLRTVGS